MEWLFILSRNFSTPSTVGVQRRRGLRRPPRLRTCRPPMMSPLLPLGCPGPRCLPSDSVSGVVSQRDKQSVHIRAEGLRGRCPGEDTDQRTQEEPPPVTNHGRRENHSDSAVPPHTGQNRMPVVCEPTRAGEAVEEGAPSPCWRECRPGQPPRKAVWRRLRKLKAGLLRGPGPQLLGVCTSGFKPTAVRVRVLAFLRAVRRQAACGV